MHYLPIVLLSLLGGAQVLDDFRYVDGDTARQAWVAGENTPPVDVAADTDRSILTVQATFGSSEKMARAVVDRKCQLDLHAPSGYTLEVSVDSPESVGYVSLYFRSGDGWYVAGKTISGRGWQPLHFPKGSFQAEGTPAGWRQIDGLRIAVWRPTGKAVNDTTIRFRQLAASWHDIAVIVGEKSKGKPEGEERAAREAAATVVNLLDDLGVGSDVLDEVAVADGALARRRIAILPYNPTLQSETLETLVRFAEAKGKVVACYLLPSRLATTLGFGKSKYIRQDRAGQFAEMRFDEAAVPGLPKSVRQNSWNITSLEPVGQNGRILARWYDDAGKPTHCPAVLLSDRGAFFSHVLLPGDHEAKQQLLAAVIGSLYPATWEDMAKAALCNAEHVGHCEKIDEVVACLKSHETDGAAASRLASAQAVWKKAQGQFADKAYAEAVQSAADAHALFAQAYLRISDGGEREGRAVWNHSGTGAYPGDWDRSAKLLAENGFNMVLPNMLWGGLAHYASDVLPRSDTFRKYGDQLEQCCAAAQKHGLEVHVWKVNYNLLGAPKEFVESMRRDGRTQVAVDGAPLDWLCPSHPENQKLELDSMLEVARKYPVAGLHFDYIRYPGRETCYCNGCRQRFETQNNCTVADWPKECHSGDRKDEYATWRCQQVTRLVEAVSREARQIRPGLKLSAAVFGSYPGCRESVAQDWPEWVKAGLLDFICPMDYSERDNEFVSMVKNQLKLVDGRVPVYPGIGATATHIALTADRVAGQIHHARSLGAAGFTIFNFDHATAESIVPQVGLGAGSRPAVPPHCDTTSH